MACGHRHYSTSMWNFRPKPNQTYYSEKLSRHKLHIEQLNKTNSDIIRVEKKPAPVGFIGSYTLA